MRQNFKIPKKKKIEDDFNEGLFTKKIKNSFDFGAK